MREAHSAAASDGDEMPPLKEEIESEDAYPSGSSDHVREAMTTTSEVATEYAYIRAVLLNATCQKEAVIHQD